MDIFFSDPTQVPLPPGEVRIRTFTAEPHPDGHRVRLYLELTPFQKRPNGEITIVDSAENEVANLSIIETLEPHMEFTVHLREANHADALRAIATIYYLPEPSMIEEPDEFEARWSNKMVVDSAQTSFRFEGE